MQLIHLIITFNFCINYCSFYKKKNQKWYLLSYNTEFLKQIIFYSQKINVYKICEKCKCNYFV